MKFPYVYPDPESRRLRAALAKDSELESEYILAGCGADELIDLIMRLEINFISCICFQMNMPLLSISLTSASKSY